MWRQAYPKSHQALFLAFVAEKINWLNDVYEPEDYVYQELKAWAEEYTQEHGLNIPDIDWEEFVLANLAGKEEKAELVSWTVILGLHRPDGGLDTYEVEVEASTEGTTEWHLLVLARERAAALYPEVDTQGVWVERYFKKGEENAD